MHLLKEFFGDRIISKNVCPPCSPDQNPPDFIYVAQQNLPCIEIVRARCMTCKQQKQHLFGVIQASN